MEIVKQQTTVHEILQVVPEAFSNYGEFKQVREKNGLSLKHFKKCFWCGHSFVDNDDVFFARVSNKGNVFFCKECSEKALKGIGG